MLRVQISVEPTVFVREVVFALQYFAALVLKDRGEKIPTGRAQTTGSRGSCSQGCHQKKVEAAGAAGLPAEEAAPAPKKTSIHDDFAKKQELKKIMAMAEEGLNSRFSDMFKAFQYVDLDRSGRLSRSEIKRALDMWNVPIDDEKLDLIMGDCDADGDAFNSHTETAEQAVAKVLRAGTDNDCGTFVTEQPIENNKLRREVEAHEQGGLFSQRTGPLV